MNNNAFLIYPTQLFKKINFLKKYKNIYLIEDELFFHTNNHRVIYHKQKIKLHRASMKWYFNYLKENLNNKVIYIETNDTKKSSLISYFSEEGIKEISTYDPVDNLLEQKITDIAQELNTKVNFLNNPNFLTDKTQITNYFKEKSYNQTSFYIWQRKRLNILIKNNKPLFGSWTFDKDNRKKLPKKGIEIPKILSFEKNEYIKEATNYVNKNFVQNPGHMKGDIDYAINHEQAIKLLEDFIQNKLINFGTYQDAITKSFNPLLFHSNFSSAINIGLINPDEILKRIEKIEVTQDNINSIEGFIRQIIGWREFIRAVYILEGEKIRNSNFFNHKNSISSDFWKATTGIIPIDDCIKKVNKNAYLHHIERLMIIGNYLLLKKTDPNEVYDWFMSMFIDSYDWVMVPNVYCMSQFAAKDLITTKPYISGSNYIHKMSDYKKDEWSKTWDKLFWNFIEDNLSYFETNPRMRLLTRRFKK